MLIFMLKRIRFYYHLVFISLTRAGKDKTAPISVQRIIVLLVLNIAGTCVFLTNWICLLMDEVIFPQYREVEIKGPFFILGVPRSGSTLFLRLLARDEKNFTSFQLWEILFAPSIIQRKIFGFLGKIDRKTGGLLTKPIESFDKRLFKSTKPIHQVGLYLVEEDAIILIWIFSTFFIFFAYPFFDQFLDYLKFDDQMPENDKKWIMAYYSRMIQRHLYYHGADKRFLSKNPTFASWVRTLNQYFPGARFLTTVRHPYQQIPSTISLMAYFVSRFGGDFLKIPDFKNIILEIIKIFYQHPITSLKKMNMDHHEFILFDDIVGNLDKIIYDIYEKFDIELSENFKTILQERNSDSKKYKNEHKYSLEQFDLTVEEIFENFKPVFVEFGFSHSPTQHSTP